MKYLEKQTNSLLKDKESEVEIKYFTASEETQYLEDIRDLWESDVNSRLYDAKVEELKRGKREKQKSF